MSESFNPHNYKSFEDLPEEKKKDYTPLKNGRFVQNSALWHEGALKGRAENQNNERSLGKKIFGVGKVSPIDIVQEDAIKDYKREEEIASILKREDATAYLVKNPTKLEIILDSSGLVFYGDKIKIETLDDSEYQKLLNHEVYESKRDDINLRMDETRILGLLKDSVIGLEDHGTLMEKGVNKGEEIGLIRYSCISRGDPTNPDAHADYFYSCSFIPNPKNISTLN